MCCWCLIQSKWTSPLPMSWGTFFNTLIVSDLLFSYLIHFELIFVKRGRYRGIVWNCCTWNSILLKRLFSSGVSLPQACGFISGVSFLFACLVCLFLMPLLWLFGYSSPIVCLETCNMMHLSLFCLLRVALGTQNFLCLWISEFFPILWIFWWTLHCICKLIWAVWTFFNNYFFSSWTWSISIFVCMFNFFH